MSFYNEILQKKKENKKSLAILLDPDKFDLKTIEEFSKKLIVSSFNYVFVGGSAVKEKVTESLVFELKKHVKIPVFIFPGDINQITDKADVLLFLSLVSGRNPEFLIGQQVKAVPKLNKSSLEVIPTGYILVDGGTETSTMRVSDTLPLNDSDEIFNTAKASEYLGMKLIYLEAGSGANKPVSEAIVSRISSNLKVPVIVGGGIKSRTKIDSLFSAGADLVVVGNIIENNPNLLTVL